MYRKYNENESSDEEGFQQAVIKVIENVPVHVNPLESLRMEDVECVVQKKFLSSCYSIYTSIPLIIVPAVLFHPLEEVIVKMDRKVAHPHTVTAELKDLGEFIRNNNLYCKYNKFQTKLDYKSDMTSLYKSFQFHLQPLPISNYRQFITKDAATNQPMEFSSNFQCGNLQFVFTNNQSTYYLLLSNDTNTHGYTHWFYFRIRNKRKCKIKLIILNVTKPPALLQNALGISVFSMQQKAFCRKYWSEGGSNLKVYRNGFRRKTRTNKNSEYYSIEFDYDFKFQSDTVYFAMNIPYSYTKLTSSFDELLKRKEHAIINTVALGKTVSNNIIYCIEFTKNHRDNFIARRKSSTFTQGQESVSSEPKETQQPIKKKAIVIVGRQHPSETNSSYIVEGIINFLSDESDASLFLLEHYQIHVIPMANPDGVIHGNSRTNLCGYDINRQWSEADEQKSKETSIISEYIRELSRRIEIKYVIDFHSHSKRLNVFGHFCDDTLQTRAFAWFLQDSNPNFNYSSCTFGKDKNKQKTLRSFGYSLGVKNSFTIEVSFFGKLEHGLYRRYNTKHLHDMGVTLMKAIGEFSEIGVPKVITNNFVKSNVQEPPLNQDVSESEPEDDYLEERQRVKIILEGRRERESLMPKGFQQRRNSISKNKPFPKLSSLNKTMMNPSNQNNKMGPPKGLMNPVQKPFKRYSEQDILKDDSIIQDDTWKRRVHTQMSYKKSHSRLYLWDQDKFNVSKLISYPTSLHPYMGGVGSNSEGESPLKRRKPIQHRYSQTTEQELERLIVDSKKRQQEKYQYIANEEKRRRCKFSKYCNKKLLPFAMSVSSLKDLNTC